MHFGIGKSYTCCVAHAVQQCYTEMIHTNEAWYCSTRKHYCFFVVRHVGTSTEQHARHSTSRYDSHDTSCLSCCGVTQQVEFWLMMMLAAWYDRDRSYSRSRSRSRSHSRSHRRRSSSRKWTDLLRLRQVCFEEFTLRICCVYILALLSHLAETDGLSSDFEFNFKLRLMVQAFGSDSTSVFQRGLSQGRSTVYYHE